MWGFICPVDGGSLIELSGTDLLHCPNNGHNGRPKTHPLGVAEPTPAFYTRDQVQEGYMADKPSGSGMTAKQINAMKASAKADSSSDAAAESAVAAPKRGKTPRECEDGCGGMTKGGRFLPGHDAKMHARLKAERNAQVNANS